MKASNNSIDTSRRNFLRKISIASAAVALGACSSNDEKADAPKRGSGKMTLRTNHNSGDAVSILGFGCMRLPTVTGESAQKSNEEIDQEALNAQIDYALEHGVNYFDSSPMYCRGRSEAVVGEALSRHPRNGYFIATKLSNFDEQYWPKQQSIAMFENSLKNFKTDYIDYYLLHSVGGGGMENMRKRYIDNGMLEFLKQKRAEGIIRNLGFSFHGDIACFHYLLDLHDKGDIHWDFVQIQLNYVNWQHPAQKDDQAITAQYLYDALQSRNIPAVVMEPLLGGSLAKVSIPIATKMAQRRPDDSPAAWAFRYAAKPGVLTVLSGMTYMEHLKDNIATYSPLEPITDDEDQFLMRIAQEILENDTVPCTGCAYCMPCPYGIDIPAIFAHFNKCVNDDLVLHDSRDPNYAKARRAFLVGYDRSVPKLRQADHCISCGNCVTACPQSINIPKQLERINAYAESIKQNKPQ